jgi:hypothetical protein
MKKDEMPPLPRTDQMVEAAINEVRESHADFDQLPRELQRNLVLSTIAEFFSPRDQAALVIRDDAENMVRKRFGLKEE